MLKELLLIRHGESAGNVARDRALAEGLHFIDIAQRDCDVPLSQTGEDQARALGRWLASNRSAPDLLLTSPYVRARETSAIAAQAAQWDIAAQIDERLREKEFGMLDRLTRAGIAAQFPDQVEMRERLGKFYYRPPGGESWADVILRLRSLFDWLVRAHEGQRVAIVSHQVVVLCMRYIIEDLDEAGILAIDRAGDVANCAVTAFERDARAPHGLVLVSYNETAPMQQQGVPVTSRADAPAGPK